MRDELRIALLHRCDPAWCGRVLWETGYGVGLRSGKGSWATILQYKRPAADRLPPRCKAQVTSRLHTMHRKHIRPLPGQQDVNMGSKPGAWLLCPLCPLSAPWFRPQAWRRRASSSVPSSMIVRSAAAEGEARAGGGATRVVIGWTGALCIAAPTGTRCWASGKAAKTKESQSAHLRS